MIDNLIVFAGVPRWWLAFDESEIVIEPDTVAASGPERLDPFPLSRRPPTDFPEEP